MNDVEVSGRLVTLEVLAMTTLGLYLANSKNDPDFSKAKAMLDHLKASVHTQAQSLPPAAQRAAQKYADHLLGLVSENLRQLRGERWSNHSENVRRVHATPLFRSYVRMM